MELVRDAHQDDVSTLIAIGLRSWERAIEGLADADRMRMVAQDAFIAFLRLQWTTVRLIERDGAACGWAARENLDGFISDLWIEPHHQGIGLGTLLLADIETQIVASGYETATITTHAQNEQAIAFLRKRGYSVSWLSTTYSQKLDRNVGSIGLSKLLVPEESATGYGPDFL